MFFFVTCPSFVGGNAFLTASVGAAAVFFVFFRGRTIRSFRDMVIGAKAGSLDEMQRLQNAKIRPSDASEVSVTLPTLEEEDTLPAVHLHRIKAPDSDLGSPMMQPAVGPGGAIDDDVDGDLVSQLDSSTDG